MAKMKDVELSTEELLDEVNYGGGEIETRRTVEVRSQKGETEKQAAERAMDEIRQANMSAAQARTFGASRAEAARDDQREANRIRREMLDNLPSDPDDIRATLDERARTHGEYSEHAATTQMLKHIMRAAPKWGDLKYHEQETLEMVAHKIGRILCGDPHTHDHWHDIAGYATLSADRNK